MMGLDFNWLDDCDTPPFLTLEFTEVQAIMPALKGLEDRTGVFVDPYGDTRISDDHAKILADEITRLKPGNPAVLRLVDLLNSAVQRKDWLFASGD